MYLYRQPHPQLSAWHGLSEAPQTAKQIYAGQSRVRELTDRGFQNIFLDRGKLIVVAFWADSCRPCDAVASTVVSVAQKIAQGPHARLVKFYHAQWDPKVNPRLHTQYGFKNVPVVFFYYMCSGTQPTRETPLLEASTRGDRFDTDAATYLRNIETILHRHGHIVPNRRVAESRGWKTSRTFIHSSDFKDIDRMLAEPSRVSGYIDSIYCMNPQLRLSRRAKVVDKSTFDLLYQRINGQRPDSDTLGVVDPKTSNVYLLAHNNALQVMLNSAVHEAVHLCACRAAGSFAFYARLGFAFNEGFTQLVTEDILGQQTVMMSGRRPYKLQREMAEKLVEKLGFTAVADDYFRCTQNSLVALNASNKLGPIQKLNSEAIAAPSEALRDDKYREIIRLLDTLPKAP